MCSVLLLYRELYGLGRRSVLNREADFAGDNYNSEACFFCWWTFHGSVLRMCCELYSSGLDLDDVAWEKVGTWEGKERSFDACRDEGGGGT